MAELIKLVEMTDTINQFYHKSYKAGYMPAAGDATNSDDGLMMVVYPADGDDDRWLLFTPRYSILIDDIITLKSIANKLGYDIDMEIDVFEDERNLEKTVKLVEMTEAVNNYYGRDFRVAYIPSREDLGAGVEDLMVVGYSDGDQWRLIADRYNALCYNTDTAKELANKLGYDFDV